MSTETALVVRDHAGNEVHRIDTTGKSDSEIERAERGLLRQMDTDRYTVGAE